MFNRRAFGDEASDDPANDSGKKRTSQDHNGVTGGWNRTGGASGFGRSNGQNGEDGFHDDIHGAIAAENCQDSVEKIDLPVFHGCNVSGEGDSTSDNRGSNAKLFR